MCIRDSPQSTSTALNFQQQEFDNKQQQHPPADSSTPNRPESISHLETVSPTRLHRVLRSRVNDYGNNWWSQTDRLYRYNFTKSCVFQLFMKKLINVSGEYNRLNGWNSTLQAAWYIRRVRIIWCLWPKPTIWLLILSFTQNVVQLNRADLIGD